MEISTLEIGDFVRNVIHNYITFLYHKNEEGFFSGLIIDTSTMTPWINDFVKEGIARDELPLELVKIESSLPLISKAKKYLDKMNSFSANMVDNLDYIEILDKLRKQEKDYENQL